MKKYIVANRSDIVEKRSRVVQVDKWEVALFKLSDGGIQAVENRCPHLGGKLSEGIVCGGHVYCPLHDWKIALNDGLVQSPDEGCVRTFQVEIGDNGEITLYMEEQGECE